MQTQPRVCNHRWHAWHGERSRPVMLIESDGAPDGARELVGTLSLALNGDYHKVFPHVIYPLV